MEKGHATPLRLRLALLRWTAVQRRRVDLPGGATTADHGGLRAGSGARAGARRGELELAHARRAAVVAVRRVPELRPAAEAAEASVLRRGLRGDLAGEAGAEPLLSTRRGGRQPTRAA